MARTRIYGRRRWHGPAGSEAGYLVVKVRGGTAERGAGTRWVFGDRWIFGGRPVPTAAARHRLGVVAGAVPVTGSPITPAVSGLRRSAGPRVGTGRPLPGFRVRPRYLALGLIPVSVRISPGLRVRSRHRTARVAPRPLIGVRVLVGARVLIGARGLVMTLILAAALILVGTRRITVPRLRGRPSTVAGVCRRLRRTVRDPGSTRIRRVRPSHAVRHRLASHRGPRPTRCPSWVYHGVALALRAPS